MKVLARVQETVALRLATPVTARQLLLVGLVVGLLSVAVFTRFWRLGTPGEFYFDEVYFPDTAQKILGKDLATDEAGPWEFFGSENTHPPLSKLLMAGGMAIFGAVTSGSITGEMDNPFAWRFFGALAGGSWRSRRSMALMACGLNVGWAFTMEAPGVRWKTFSK